MKQNKNWSRSRRSSSTKPKNKKTHQGKKRKSSDSNYSSCNTSSESHDLDGCQPVEGKLLKIIRGLEAEEEFKVLSLKLNPLSLGSVEQEMTIDQNPDHPEFRKYFQYNKYYQQEFQQSLMDENVFLGNSLSHQNISYYQRARMVDWMIQVFGKYSSTTSDATFFRAVSIMDFFFQKSIKQYSHNDLHLIGITSMFIATKLEDIQFIPLKQFVTKISRNKFSTSDIKEMEKSILETLNFKITFPTSLDYLQNIFYQCFNLNDNPILQNILKTSIYILKMCLHDYSMTSFNSYTLASSAFLYSIKDYVSKMNLFNTEFIINQFFNKVMEISQIDQTQIDLCLNKTQDLIRSFKIKYPQLYNLSEFQ
ncbi:unnamed protein product (macronuclear) [Paramecium tetraurelia]|uniref:Cyclin-like domain-containing protein n=1 Tax=Paramecium tetraurelia TaxID=5888 RepID=A0DL45_PARTE|nr:uncharacterized protein GSPATT00018079001 [Paramecium tetraurelia]CAK83762.1 unnamed protein product [Paramecium tetraurelia]|eukprot:XP_001451159.1 hypothetical protein (macronuclear) [Paramecium tetraurelia strain d4-2]